MSEVAQIANQLYSQLKEGERRTWIIQSPDYDTSIVVDRCAALIEVTIYPDRHIDQSDCF